MTHDWWRKIRYFKPHEFDSPDLPGSGRRMSPKLVRILDKIRQAVGFPLKVNSGFRTKAHNKKVKGKSRSAHLRAFAADIRARNSRLRFAIIAEAIRLGVRRIGIAKTFIHLDVDSSLPQEVVWLY